MTSRADRISHLVALLESEERVYVELRSLLQREREHMATLDAQALAGVVEAKEMTAAEARYLEESRLALAGALAAEVGLGAERPTLSELCAALGPPADALRELHARLVAVVGAVRELVEANSSFAGDSLIQIQGALRLFGRMSTVESTYGGPGREEGAAVPGRLVRRTA